MALANPLFLHHKPVDNRATEATQATCNSSNMVFTVVKTAANMVVSESVIKPQSDKATRVLHTANTLASVETTTEATTNSVAAGEETTDTNKI